MLKYVLLMCLILSNHIKALELKGHLTQGGMVTGQLKGIKQVKLNDQVIAITPKGQFVFGFGRDAELFHTLAWQTDDDKWHSQAFFITKREYDIDRINGVEQKYVSPPKSVIARTKKEAAAVRQARDTLSNRVDFLSPIYRPAAGRISGIYGSQRYFNGTPKRPHFGLDIANKTGTAVYAPLAGKVIFANSDLYYSGGTLIIDHGYGVTTTYIHLHKLDVEVGQEINLGDKIAEIGATGRVTGPHLDWRLNWGQVRLDPQLLMQAELASKFK
jgi:murein DD-endopeptidase MepM/ murein hydrolase activator NlpD